MPLIAVLEERNIITYCPRAELIVLITVIQASYTISNTAKQAGTIPCSTMLTAASKLAPATWTGVGDEVPLAVPVAPEPPVPPDPPVEVALEPPADGEAEGIAFVGSTAGSYLSQTAPSAKGHCKSRSQSWSYES